MTMTMTEQVLAKAAKRDRVRPGETVWVDVDVLMTHDVCGPGTIGIFKKQFGANAKVWDPDKLVIIPDHYIFTADPMANRNVDVLREFAKEQGLKYYYDVGTENYKGVCHIAMPVANSPKAPAVQVWLSVPSKISPGRVCPSSGMAMWQTPL